MPVLILHGIGGHAGIHWQQWLHDELEQRGLDVVMPNLSNSARPDRKQWLEEVQDAIADIPAGELVIVGHSLGVTTALDLIEDTEAPFKALVSVSGFAIDYGAELNSYFLRERQLDFAAVRQKVDTSMVFYGDDDPYVPQAALERLAVDLDTAAIIVPKGGHLNTDSGFLSFPQLLEAILAEFEA